MSAMLHLFVLSTLTDLQKLRAYITEKVASMNELAAVSFGNSFAKKMLFLSGDDIVQRDCEVSQIVKFVKELQVLELSKRDVIAVSMLEQFGRLLADSSFESSLHLLDNSCYFLTSLELMVKDDERTKCSARYRKSIASLIYNSQVRNAAGGGHFDMIHMRLLTM